MGNLVNFLWNARCKSCIPIFMKVIHDDILCIDARGVMMTRSVNSSSCRIASCTHKHAGHGCSNHALLRNSWVTKSIQALGYMRCMAWLIIGNCRYNGPRFKSVTSVLACVVCGLKHTFNFAALQAACPSAKWPFCYWLSMGGKLTWFSYEIQLLLNASWSMDFTFNVV